MCNSQFSDVFQSSRRGNIQITPVVEKNTFIFNISCANSYGEIDAIRQAIKDSFDQEDLKQLINIKKCLIGATNKETAQDVEEKLACISDLIKKTLIEKLLEFPYST